MRTARKYIANEIYRSTAVILIALVGLFVFFALIDGLDKVGKKLTVMQLLYIQMLDMPNYLYELLPIGLLIGAVLALAGLAQRNELTILRASGVSGIKLLSSLWLICIPLVIVAFLLSEFITPAAEMQGGKTKLELLGHTEGGRMSSGYWFRESDSDGNARIINIKDLLGNGSVSNVALYEFGAGNTLQAYITAANGQFKDKQLIMNQATQTIILPGSSQALADGNIPEQAITSIKHLETYSIETTLTQERLLARVLTPERMAITDLLDYIHYLEQNNQLTERQEIALWRKIAYPFTLLVMITIAAPIGFLQTRRGGVSIKMFMGIILGVGFFMLNELSQNAGMLGDWPPWATAIFPSAIGLSSAITALLAMENSHTISIWRRTRRLQKQTL